MKKYYVFTGPECSGKTSLANITATKYNLPLVEEYARSYLENLNRKYNNEDLDQIALEQENLELKYVSQPRILCDTDLLTIFIWRQEVYYIEDSNWVQKLERFHSEDRLYFLCSPTDIPWQWDAQRENPHDRDRLYDLYKNALINFQLNFIEIKGSFEKRLALIHKAMKI